MTAFLLRVMIAAYRANPVRPHCDGKAGRHTRPCRLIMPQISPFLRASENSWPLCMGHPSYCHPENSDGCLFTPEAPCILTPDPRGGCD